MIKEECDKEKFKFEYDSPDDFTRCFWQKQPTVLPIWIAYRLVVFVYFVITSVISIIFRADQGYVWYKNFIYIGYWAYFLETLFFGMAFGVAVEKFVKEKKNPRLPPLEDMPWHYKLLWFSYDLIAPITIANTVMFWFFVYDPKIHIRLYLALITGLSNTVFLLLEMFISAIPYRFLHFYVTLLFPVSYLSFTAIYQFSGGTGNRGQIPIFVILDWRKPVKALTTCSIVLMCVFVFHCGICVLYLIKLWLRKAND